MYYQFLSICFSLLVMLLPCGLTCTCNFTQLNKYCQLRYIIVNQKHMYKKRLLKVIYSGFLLYRGYRYRVGGSVGRLANRQFSINQSISHSVSQSANPSINQLVIQSISQSFG